MSNGRKIIIVAIRSIIQRIERINLVPVSRVIEGVKCVYAKLNQLREDILVCGRFSKFSFYGSEI